MGVSGVGKSTVGCKLSQRFGLPFLEGDEFHSAENIAKMKRGEPLTDADRAPWTGRIVSTVDDMRDERIVLACSALTPSVRASLSKVNARHVSWVLLTASAQVIQARMMERDHFMPESLLDSQFAALTLSDDLFEVDAARTLSDILQTITEYCDLAEA